MSWSRGSGGGGGAGRHWLRWRSAAQIGFVIKDNGDNSNNRKFLATSTDTALTALIRGDESV